MSKLPEHLVKTIEGLVDLNMVDEAAKECLRTVELQPDNEDLLVYCAGQVSLASSEYIRELLVPIERYLQTRPQSYRMREVYAVLLSLEHRYPESFAEFAKVPPDKLRHETRWVWFKSLVQSGASDEVRRWIAEDWPSYSARVKKESFREYLKFLWDVSACLADDGQYEEAAIGYRYVLVHDPTAIGIYLDYGKLLARMGHEELAANTFRHGLRLTDRQIDEQSSYPGGILGFLRHERRDIEQQIREELRNLEGSTDERLPSP